MGPKGFLMPSGIIGTFDTHNEFSSELRKMYRSRLRPSSQDSNLKGGQITISEIQPWVF